MEWLVVAVLILIVIAFVVYVFIDFLILRKVIKKNNADGKLPSKIRWM